MIPDWVTCKEHVDEGIATKLELFIYNHEPAGHTEETAFRTELEEALEEAVEQSKLIEEWKK